MTKRWKITLISGILGVMQQFSWATTTQASNLPYREPQQAQHLQVKHSQVKHQVEKHSRLKHHLPQSRRVTSATKKARQSQPEANRSPVRHYDPLTGTASHYASKFAGRRTASGSRLDLYDFVAAHPTLPLGTKLKVTNLSNGKSVYVTVVDRMRRGKHIIDLTDAGASYLGIYGGIAKVQLAPVSSATFAAELARQCSEVNSYKPKPIASQVELGDPQRRWSQSELVESEVGAVIAESKL